MFRAAALLSLCTFALALSPSDLKVSIKAVESTVASVEDIVITTIVSNPTTEDIRVIGKNNVLDGSATRSFAVTKDDGSVMFTGIRSTLDLTADSIYTTIPAGSSIAVNHTVGALYDFEHSGTGSFEFTPNTLFQTAPDTEPVEIAAETVSVEVTHDVAKRELYPGQHLARRTSTPTCGDSSKLSVITNALADARARAGGAASDIKTHPNGPEYTAYFGGNAQNDIWFNFDRIAGDLSSVSKDRKIWCNSDPAGLCGANSGVIAYTVVVTSGGQIVGSDIYNCQIFFDSVRNTPSICAQGFDATTSSKGGVILHELSHATSGSNDIAYGCSAASGLSVANKKNNADNYRCMGLAIYKDYVC
ncbi:Neutral protease 2 [Mycena kentingensis (nom. inval.)]|nr:Neutral protease 2 [Mycena kentingensis (nom. inval.)]